ncbi:hypothetical protein SAMN05421503_2448 [Terribacillus aidingensis]|uniref:Uncharacterized protein n=1 Tax=Terribacillus aidingensis TaxID=586416 RepID=A0A285P2Z3_9BACI|nr:hypothetical protein [Terribacillus aidingensis]SNZ14526.1 hypothetical protein SAMN05421503_2448 [Terribacillus aidingensis]
MPEYLAEQRIVITKQITVRAKDADEGRKLINKGVCIVNDIRQLDYLDINEKQEETTHGK